MKFLIYEGKKLKAKSTDGDEWYKYAYSGGYTVHPVPGLG